MIFFFLKIFQIQSKKTKSLIVKENFIELNENLGTEHLFLSVSLFVTYCLPSFFFLPSILSPPPAPHEPRCLLLSA